MNLSNFSDFCDSVGVFVSRIILSDDYMEPGDLGEMTTSIDEFYDVTVQYRVAPDGDTVHETSAHLAPDGWTQVSLAALAPGEYYVVVRHINHLDVMSAELVVVDGSAGATVDFTVPGTAWTQNGFGSPPLTDYLFDDGLMRMWGGDVVSDGILDWLDYGVLSDDMDEYAIQGPFDYLVLTDVNGDGFVDNSDWNAWKDGASDNAVSHVPGDVKRPFGLTTECEDDVTRQVRLHWQYPGPVNIQHDDGDASGYYVETFAGATTVAGVEGGTWLDVDAPAVKARYYRVQAVDTGQLGIDTVMKWDFVLDDCGPKYAVNFGMPCGGCGEGTTLVEAIGNQMPCALFMPQSGTGLSVHSHDCQDGEWHTPTGDWEIGRHDGFFLSWDPEHCPTIATVVGGVLSGDCPNIAVLGEESYYFLSTALPVPVVVSDIGFQGAVGGESQEESDEMTVWYEPGPPSAWTNCWLFTDGHWRYEGTNAPCDGAQLLPGRSYWYKHKGNGCTLTFPKPYSNP